MNVIKFPKRNNFKDDQDYLDAMNKHFKYIEQQLKNLKLKKGKQSWCDNENVIHVDLPLNVNQETLKAAKNNLVNFACHKGKSIVEACQFEQDNILYLYAKVV